MTDIVGTRILNKRYNLSSTPTTHIQWFSNLRKDDTVIVGGKIANLGELLSFGINVPQGFAVTTLAYKKFLEENNLSEKINQILKSVKNARSPDHYEKASKQIRKLIESAPMPLDVENSIKRSYLQLSKIYGKRNIFVAVRSSATSEDLENASFAGMQDTFLNIRGEEELLNYIKKCWSSLFTPRAIFYREQKGFPHNKIFISVGIQKMVKPKVAGVMFTVDPVSMSKNKLVIEGNWGLGESVVSGSVIPDHFEVDKESLALVNKILAHKKEKFIRNKDGKTVKVKVAKELRNKFCLTSKEIFQLSDLGKRIEKYYKKPQDIEWAIENGKIFIVQSRPITTL